MPYNKNKGRRIAPLLAALYLLPFAPLARAEEIQLFPDRPHVETQQKSNSIIKNQEGAENETPLRALLHNEHTNAESEYGGEEGSEYWPTFLGLRLKITDTLLVLFTLVLALVTANLARSTKKLWQAAADQGSDMKDSVAAAQKAAAAAELAAKAAVNVEILKIFLTHVEFIRDADGDFMSSLLTPCVEARVTNFGRSPAFVEKEDLGIYIGYQLPKFRQPTH